MKNEFNDHVFCNNCLHEMVVDLGSDECLNCGEKGTLSWACDMENIDAKDKETWKKVGIIKDYSESLNKKFLSNHKEYYGVDDNECPHCGGRIDVMETSNMIDRYFKCLECGAEFEVKRIFIDSDRQTFKKGDRVKFKIDTKKLVDFFYSRKNEFERIKKAISHYGGYNVDIEGIYMGLDWCDIDTAYDEESRETLQRLAFYQKRSDLVEDIDDPKKEFWPNKESNIFFNRGVLTVEHTVKGEI